MALEKLGDKLRGSLQRLFKATHIDAKLIDQITADIKKSLIAADVNIDLTNKLTETIKRRALAEKSSKLLTAREHTVNIVYDELVKFLGAEAGKLEIEKKPTKIVLQGLFGSGKTTTASKLAKYYKKKGLKVALVQTDTWRPAAFEQLQQLAEKINVPFYGIKGEKDPIKIIKKFEPDFDNFNVVILDTAGRDALNSELIKEIKAIKEAFRPDESLLVLSGDIGQTAFKQADTFKDAVGISGVILTKLDGTAKGGGALSACSATGAKVKFIGVGEHIEDFEEYKPKNFVSRLLGMGDLETLLKKAEEVMDKETAEELGKKFLKAEFTLTDVYKQMESVKKLGPLSQVVGMIPGMANAIPKELLEMQEDKMKNWKYIIDSCTIKERDNPDIIKTSRISRIAKGSGKSEQDVRDLIKQYNQMKKVMKQMGNPKQLKKLEKLMNMRGLKGMPGF
ncbi:MAG: signal recognition particle protein Srp54 [DPANN group archaeon]|nr:signal recognition particle protein Srp54 [DPANN group archaeon]